MIQTDVRNKNESLVYETSTQSNNVNGSKSISSLEEFEQKYSIKVDEGILCLTERTSKVVLTKLETKNNPWLCTNYGNPSHFHEGTYYFVLGSKRYTGAKHVYSYNLNTNAITYIIAPLTNPHFFKNLLVSFGAGFNAPGPQSYMHTGEGGVITLYDLSKPQGSKEIKKIYVRGGSCGGWDGEIDKEEETISAFDHVTGETRTYPLFDKI